MAKINYQLNNNIPAFKNFLGIVVILIIAFILNSQIENLQGGTALSLSLWLGDRKSTRLNSSHVSESRMPSSA